jgi:aerotaxis receptor
VNSIASGASPVPSGVARAVGRRELFFSTTDRAGAIRTGNSVFIRFSQYSLEELTGAPHSIVRHPDMPAGAFRLMWDRLLAGRPMAAYVENLAKDGSSYWVFATVTPLGQGFLSVRSAPHCRALFEEAQRVYALVVERERQLAEHARVDRREVARIGAELIEQLLCEVGFATYDEFLLEALPAEISARGRLTSTAGVRPGLSAPLVDLLSGTARLESLLGHLVGQLEGYRVLSDQLVEASSRVLDVALRLDRAVMAAQQASATVSDTAPVLCNIAAVMARPMHSAVNALEALAPQLRLLKANVATLRFRIGLATLHNDMVAAFAAEVAEGRAPATALKEVPLLCDAVHDGVVEMSFNARLVNEGLRGTARLIEAAVELLDQFGQFLGQWRILVWRHRGDALLEEYLPPIDEEIAASRGNLEMLRELGRECCASTVPLDEVAFEAELNRIRAATPAT